MEKPDKISIAICMVTGLIILFMVVAGYKAEKNHLDKLALVAHLKIKETARECYLKGDCEGQITLQDLYDKTGLAPMIDPVTKEDMDKHLCLKYIDKIVEFCK